MRDRGCAGVLCIAHRSMTVGASSSSIDGASDLVLAARPERVGFSSQRLQRLTEAVRADVGKGLLPGAVILIARNGEVAYHEALGFQDREANRAMSVESIFRIASLTKPITSVALMLLVEEGRVQLEDAIGVYLPELKDFKVGVETMGANGGRELALEPARRDPTVQDLLRHTSGFTYGHFGTSLVKQTYRDVRIQDENQAQGEFISKLARLPLASHPGTTWDYGVSVDVIGRIVEVVSGVQLDRFIAERITGALGMASTAYYVTPERLARLAEPQCNPATGQRPPMRNVARRPRFLNAGGGMVSTAIDYARFAQMLLNGGELGGVRLLSPRTVAYMTTDHLPPGCRCDGFYATDPDWTMVAPALERGYGFGLGFAVRKARGVHPLPGSPGEYYWVGASGTTFWIDPLENLLAVWMSQIPWSQSGHYRSLFRNLVYQALIHP
jgi:CubicO group peptidase (beta-lactamase class C family)